MFCMTSCTFVVLKYNILYSYDLMLFVSRSWWFITWWLISSWFISWWFTSLNLDFQVRHWRSWISTTQTGRTSLRSSNRRLVQHCIVRWRMITKHAQILYVSKFIWILLFYNRSENNNIFHPSGSVSKHYITSSWCWIPYSFMFISCTSSTSG